MFPRSRMPGPNGAGGGGMAQQRQRDGAQPGGESVVPPYELFNAKEYNRQFRPAVRSSMRTVANLSVMRTPEFKKQENEYWAE